MTYWQTLGFYDAIMATEIVQLLVVGGRCRHCECFCRLSLLADIWPVNMARDVHYVCMITLSQAHYCTYQQYLHARVGIPHSGHLSVILGVCVCGRGGGEVCVCVHMRVCMFTSMQVLFFYVMLGIFCVITDMTIPTDGRIWNEHEKLPLDHNTIHMHSLK